MKKRAALILLLICLGVITMLRAQQPDYAARKAEAEKYYSEGSYARAHEIYASIDTTQLPPVEARWVQFRSADTLWRSEAATETSDTTKYEQAQRQLEELVRDIQRQEEKDRLWVEVQQSLGDFYWIRRDSRNWGSAWQYYQNALDWWAGSDQLDLARQRYLAIVWTIARPAWVEPYYYYGYYGNVVPIEVLQNVLKIATTESDRAHAHYLIAMTVRHQGGNYEMRKRAETSFESAIKGGKQTGWYDDALFYYAEWLSQNGRLLRKEDGSWRAEPDFVRAVELYRQLIAEHAKGETRYYDQAQQRLNEITRSYVNLSVSNIFVPGSEIEYHLAWRNTKQIRMALYSVNLFSDVRFATDESPGSWLQKIDISGKQPTKSWIKETQDKGDHRPGQELLRLDDKPAPGAYLLEAKAGEHSARDLVLVTDSAVVLKTSGRKALIYYANASNGSPIAGAQLKVWEKYYDGANHRWSQNELTTNQEGIAVQDLKHTQSNMEIFVAASRKEDQAFTIGSSYYYPPSYQDWRIYAVTDRPAYRPGEQVQWKFTARARNDAAYTTPADQVVEYTVFDPRGTKIAEGKPTLNTFGSAWGTIDLTDKMPLGEYRIDFQKDGSSIGSATLFRLEEYKLPEFKVAITTPEENGKKKTFRLGDTVEVSIEAAYYFGGPVSNANVEVLVYQQPFYHWWRPEKDYAWYYEDLYIRPHYWGRGTVMKRETLKTDAEGKARLTVETQSGGQELELRIEARVTDASRREITGADTVRVTKQSYYVYPKPAHYLYRPQDKVQIDIKTIDANNQPVQAEGAVKVTRDFWFEIWLDPNGKEIKGEELRALQDKIGIFPPPPGPSGQQWKLKFRGYQHDEILTRPIKTDAKGEAEFIFTPERDGYYRIAWSSKEADGAPITAESTVWVATNATTELGYRHGGLEIIVDKDTFRAGQTAPVMLSVPSNDRYVLFTVEGEELYDYKLVHVTGTVKLVELPIEEKHAPNIFLSGAMVSDRQLFNDTEQVIVPPVRNFLQVDVAPDRPQYQPREEGTLTITTKNADGKPVSAEVSLGLVDESVFYIQQDYAGDPRQFYFGDKREQRVQMMSTFQIKSYKMLEQKEELDRQYREDVPGGRDYGVEGGVAGGALSEEFNVAGETTAADSMMAQAVPPPPAPSPEPAKAAKRDMKEMANAPAEVPDQAVTVRSDFRSTVFWQPDLVTGAEGKAVVKVKYPDSLTGWAATARAATTAAQFGTATASTRTRQPLIVRLQAPRFFVAGDSVTISAVINNNTDAALTVNTVLETDGLAMPRIAHPTATVPANGEQRVDWSGRVMAPGTLRLKVTSRGGEHADAMEKTYPVYEHGIERFLAKSGKARAEDITIKMDIPAQRKKESTHLTVQVTPSMAVTMLDALPYLVDYPYGCTEQTMSRFLPAVIVQKTLRDLGIARASLDERIFGGIESASAAKTHPEGKKDLRKLDDMVKQGLDRLYDFQHTDGGWGWWKEGESDHFMTGYVLWGLTLAHNAGVEHARDDAARRAAEFLAKELVEQEESYDLQSWMLHALSAYRASHRVQAGEFEKKAFDNLWKNRDRLNAYTRALLALSAHAYGYTEQAQTLVRNLENGVKKDTAPDTSIVMRGAQTSDPNVIGTAHWGEDGFWWRWSDGAIESTAFALRALLAIDPKNPLIEPVTNWLIKNRRGAQWSNTRDTAISVLTLTEYLRTSGELKNDMEYELSVNGSIVANKRITPQEVLSAPSRFVIDRQLIQDGSNEIRIRSKSGSGTLYFAAEVAFFSLEEPIPASGSELFVRRQYYRLVGKPTLLKGYIYERRPLNDNETVKSGERIETVVTIETKNDYEYLVFEDLKPAGFEAVEIRSGESLHAREIKSGAVATKMKEPATKVASVEPVDYTMRTRWVYQELRDRKVALFVDKLPQGVWEIRYELRAEVPGQFHALPLLGHAMYVPEIRANDDEIRVTVTD